MATELKQSVPSVEAVNNALGIYVDMIKGKKPAAPHNYLYASARRKCLRRSVYECTRPELMPEYDTDTRAKFLRGEQREIDLRNELTKAGQISEPPFEFVGIQESVEILDRKGRMIIKGYIDGNIKWSDRSVWPAETKAWHPNLVDRVSCFDDLLMGTWTWSGAHQLLSYMYAKSVPFGVFILDRSGLPKLIPVSLEANLEHMESFLNDAESVVNHIEAGTLPDHIQDVDECGRCPFYQAVCDPPLMSGEGAQIITDPEVEQMLLRRDELRENSKEYTTIDKKIKSRFRGIDLAMAGKFLMQGVWGKKGDDPKGMFTLKITRVDKKQEDPEQS